MKRIKDFIYNFSDIFITLLVVAIAGGVIIWRVQVIMAYSSTVTPSKPEKEIDIDFSDIDLNVDPEDDPDDPSGEGEGNEENQGDKPDVSDVVIDENFKAYKTIYVSIPAGSTLEKAVRFISESFDELPADKYASLYSYLWTTGVNLGAAQKVQIGNFTIPEGSGIKDMINIICGGQLF